MSQKAVLLSTKITKKIRLKYLVFLPKKYAQTKKKWPLILFLHGSGERGENLEKVKVHGLPKIVDAKPDFPFVVVSPQCPDETWWQTDGLIALLDSIEKKYRIDASRIYVTGLSMGGFGTWELAVRQPDRFAAIAPVCGGAIPLVLYGIKDVPTWVFHGGKDNVVVPEESTRLVDFLKKIGGKPKLTIYPEAGHDSWTETYANPKLYEWFLEQRKKK